MKRYILILLLAIYSGLSIHAQYVSINADIKTMAVMAATGEAQVLEERKRSKDAKEILKSYGKAGGYSTAVFTTKYLDRKALTSLGVFGTEENYYYKQIYSIVANRIIPKTVRVILMMVKDPSTALYWGSYLGKTFTDVKALCQEFESVVTDSMLTFRDIYFIEFTDEFKEVFDLTKFNGRDFKETFEGMGMDFQGLFTKESLEHDLKKAVENSIKKIPELVTGGFNINLESLMAGTNFGKIADKATTIISLVENTSNLIESKTTRAVSLLKAAMSGDIGRIIKISQYDMRSWADDYTSSEEGQYFTQTARIYREKIWKEIVCQYTPPTNELNSNHWVHYTSSKSSFNPTKWQEERAIRNSEARAGWSRRQIRQLNQQNASKGISYEMATKQNYHRMRPMLGQPNYTHFYSYDITVTKTTTVRELVYEETFDSYRMDWEMFRKSIESRKQQFELYGIPTDSAEIEAELEAEFKYVTEYGDRKYYQAPTDKELKAANTVVFTITCRDTASLGRGSNVYSCRKCGKEVNDHTRQCCLYTSLPNEGEATAVEEIQQELDSVNSQLPKVQAEIDKLNSDIYDLNNKVNSQIPESEKAPLRTEIATKQARLDEYEGLMLHLDTMKTGLTNALTEAQNEDNMATDTHNRLPKIMKDMKDAFGLKWIGEGSFIDNHTFVREAKIADSEMVSHVKLVAKVTIDRPPKYFLGIKWKPLKTSNAHVKIDWKVSSEWSTSSLGETMELDTTLTNEQKKERINQKISELARKHPACDIKYDVFDRKGIHVEDNGRVKHLIWASDRLDIARNVHSRLIAILADLMMIEKFMHYKVGIKDWAKILLRDLRTDRGKRKNIAEKCHDRWKGNADSIGVRKLFNPSN